MKIIVGETESGKRLDQILANASEGLSRSRIKKLIEQGLCSLNGQITYNADQRLRTGEEAILEIPEQDCSLRPESGDVDILWQDEHLAVCVKPPDLTVHPCASQPGNTLTQRLLSIFPQLVKQGGDRPGIAHRLDKDTSGLLLIALDESTRLKLVDAFAQRRIHKRYLALVHGLMPEEGQIDEPIGRHPQQKTKMAVVPLSHGGKIAKTKWKRLWHSQNKAISLVDTYIFTGRTHQIRVHFAHLGHPVIGDKAYAPENMRHNAPRQMLHAWQLALDHPITGEKLHFICPPPADFFQAALNCSFSVPNIVITGNPGCGKSLFCKMLADLGLPAINADDLVADLYNNSCHIRDWLQIRGFEKILTLQDRVDKKALLPLLEKDAEFRKDFENFVHQLVLAEIKKFFNIAPATNPLGKVAEIPLYFESEWQNMIDPSPLTIGVHCDKNTRWQRIRSGRNWPDHKIIMLENWQMPEATKMALCDLVIDNDGDEKKLLQKAKDFVSFLQEKKREDRNSLEGYLKKLCC